MFNKLSALLFVFFTAGISHASDPVFITYGFGPGPGDTIIRTLAIDAGKSVVGPHIDRIRNYSLLYPIVTGGNNVTTVFYRLKDPKKSRAEFFYNDISELEEIARVRIPQNTWCILDTKTIHAVERLDSTRVTVQVGLWDYVGLPDVQ